MFYRRDSQETAYLKEFLRHAAKLKFNAANIAIPGVTLLFTGILLVLKVPLWVDALAGVAAFASFAPFILEWQRPERQRDLRLSKTAGRMSQAIQYRTLHRELGDSTVEVLEECARQWSRIQLIFRNSFWSDPRLTGTYLQAKLNANEAVERAMEEILFLFEPHFSQGARQRNAAEFIEDTLNDFVLKSKNRPSNFIPVGFDEARKTADRLRILADQVEKMNQAVPAQGTVSSRGLEQSLLELRDLQKAEEELEQKLQE